MPTALYKNRPTCETRGCFSLAGLVRDHYDGSALYRKVCGNCHVKKIAASHGKTVTQLVNQWHPYLRYRKTYCENQDGRLGFTCTTTIYWDGMLDVDHKNGDPSDNRERNLQTLCKCCHAYKTVKNKDYRTPGRKALGLAA
jgi:cytochrome c553